MRREGERKTREKIAKTSLITILEKVSSDLYKELQNALSLSGRLDAECVSLRRELDLARSNDKTSDRLSQQLLEETARAKGLERSIAEFQSLLQEASSAGSKHAARVAELEGQLDVTQSSLGEKSDEVYRLRSRNEKLQANAEALEVSFSELKRQSMILNDKIVELQGNVRVFARVRPLVKADATTSSQLASNCKFPDYNMLEFASVPYEFDRVFGPESGQKEVFDELVPAVRGGAYLPSSLLSPLLLSPSLSLPPPSFSNERRPGMRFRLWTDGIGQDLHHGGGPVLPPRCLCLCLCLCPQGQGPGQGQGRV